MDNGIIIVEGPKNTLWRRIKIQYYFRKAMIVGRVRSFWNKEYDSGKDLEAISREPMARSCSCGISCTSINVDVLDEDGNFLRKTQKQESK